MGKSQIVTVGFDDGLTGMERLNLPTVQIEVARLHVRIVLDVV